MLLHDWLFFSKHDVHYLTTVYRV